MEVRKLTEADIEPLWDLRLRALQDNPEAFSTTYEEALHGGKERLLQRLCHKDTFYLGAFEHTLLGMLGCIREEGVKNRHKAHIISVYVAPEGRGLGIGKALLDEAIAQAKNITGLEQLYLEVIITPNSAARRLYLSSGFEIYGVRPKALKLGEHYWDEELMVRWLA